MQKRVNGDGSVTVTFELSGDVSGGCAFVCGEFNGWARKTLPMKRASDGRFVATIDLPAGRAYRFRYLIDEDQWVNDWEADAYVPNDFGGDDSVVDLTTV